MHRLVTCPASIESSHSYIVKFSLICSLWFQTAYNLLPFGYIKDYNIGKMNSKRNKTVSVVIPNMSVLEEDSSKFQPFACHVVSCGIHCALFCLYPLPLLAYFRQTCLNTGTAWGIH